jgi:type IV pili sensor histidine kinase/response regulator
MSLLDALKTLASPTHYLVIDPVHRLISFQVRENYKLLMSDRRRESSISPQIEGRSNNGVTENEDRDPIPVPSDSAHISALSSPPASGSAHRYGPVKPGERLWPIAETMGATMQVSTDRMMVALIYMNQNAFYFNNMNCLKIGAYLEPPTTNVLAKIRDADARVEVRRQYRAWAEQTKDNAHANQCFKEKRE